MLIVYAHPNKDGHCGYILKTLQAKLKEKGEKPTLLDLYKMNFNPVMQPEEHYTSHHREIAAETKKIQELILEHDKMVFIYPTWWNGVPAILKGFFDRVLVSHFAFRYVAGVPLGLLKGKKAAVITTTGGPVIYEKTWAGNRSLKVVTKDTLWFCGIKAKGFMIGNATDLTDKQKRKILKKVISLLKNLN